MDFDFIFDLSMKGDGERLQNSLSNIVYCRKLKYYKRFFHHLRNTEPNYREYLFTKLLDIYLKYREGKTLEYPIARLFVRFANKHRIYCSIKEDFDSISMWDRVWTFWLYPACCGPSSHWREDFSYEGGLGHNPHYMDNNP